MREFRVVKTSVNQAGAVDAARPGDSGRDARALKSEGLPVAAIGSVSGVGEGCSLAVREDGIAPADISPGNSLREG